MYGILSSGIWGTPDPKTKKSLTASINEIWASITPMQCHRLIVSMPQRIKAVIKAKGFPTKYWKISFWKYNMLVDLPKFCKNKQINTWNHLKYVPCIYKLWKFNFLNGIVEINQLFHDILFFWKGPVCIYIWIYIYI